MTASGAASYQKPIEIPPGAAGTQPQLGLSHNSQSGNGYSVVAGLWEVFQSFIVVRRRSFRTGIFMVSTSLVWIDSA